MRRFTDLSKTEWLIIFNGFNPDVSTFLNYYFLITQHSLISLSWPFPPISKDEVANYLLAWCLIRRCSSFLLVVKKKKKTRINVNGNKECLSMDHTNSFTIKRGLCWREKKRQKKDSRTNSKKMSVLGRCSLRAKWQINSLVSILYTSKHAGHSNLLLQFSAHCMHMRTGSFNFKFQPICLVIYVITCCW